VTDGVKYNSELWLLMYLQVLAIEFITFAIEFITFAIEFVTLIEFVPLARKFICNKIGSCSKHGNKM